MILKLVKDTSLNPLIFFTEDGKINNNAPNEYIGLDRFEARKKVIDKLKELQIFEKKKP